MSHSPIGASVSTGERSTEPSIDVEKGILALDPGEPDLDQSKDGPAQDKDDGGPVSKKLSVNSVSSVPNGGLRAWLVVAGSFFLFFNSWGIANMFGVYQAYYETNFLSSYLPSTIAWVGSIQGFLLMFISSATGPIYDAGYARELVYAGTFFSVFGTMMLSISKRYWQVLLAQAISIGLGGGCLFVPSVAIISTYFTTKIATATGIAAMGSGLGGVIYPIVFRQLQPRIGFGWTTRVIGFIMLTTLVVPIVTMKVRVRPASRRKIVDWSAFREPPYLLFNVGAFLGFTGLYAPFFYVQTYAIETGITSVDFTFYLLSIINGASIFGRLIPNFIADHLGPFNIIIPCVAASGILVLALMSIQSLPGLVIFCILFGFFSGTFVSLPPTILVALSPNRGLIGTRMGMAFAIVAAGLLIGPPVAGAVLSASGFRGVWAFGGSLMVTGALFIGLARASKIGWSLAVKG